MLRVVLDTNIIVSSLLVPAGVPAQIMQAWRERRFLLIICTATIAEVLETLSYPRIRRKYPVSDSELTRLLALFQRDALLVTGQTSSVSGALPDDPSDEMVLASAVEAQADGIVSGDRHLLAIGSFQSIPVETARRFVESRLEG